MIHLVCHSVFSLFKLLQIVEGSKKHIIVICQPGFNGLLIRMLCFLHHRFGGLDSYGVASSKGDCLIVSPPINSSEGFQNRVSKLATYFVSNDHKKRDGIFLYFNGHAHFDSQVRSSTVSDSSFFFEMGTKKLLLCTRHPISAASPIGFEVESCKDDFREDLIGLGVCSKRESGTRFQKKILEKIGQLTILTEYFYNDVFFLMHRATVGTGILYYVSRGFRRFLFKLCVLPLKAFSRFESRGLMCIAWIAQVSDDSQFIPTAKKSMSFFKSFLSYTRPYPYENHRLIIMLHPKEHELSFLKFLYRGVLTGKFFVSDIQSHKSSVDAFFSVSSRAIFELAEEGYPCFRYYDKTIVPVSSEVLEKYHYHLI